jgi:hypothetical protein
MTGFDRMLSVFAGVAGVILLANMVELDWQLVLMALRDATYGRWAPEFNVDLDLNKFMIRWGT